MMEAQGIEVSVSFVGSRLDIALMEIKGCVDTATCQELAGVFQSLYDKNRYLIVSDLSNVSYISSAGWGVFVGEIKNIRQNGGDLKVAQMMPEVFEVFEMLEFNKILNSYETVEEAVDEFDIIRGIDISEAGEPVIATEKDLLSRLQKRHSEDLDFAEQSSKQGAGFHDMNSDSPLEQKIKEIVVEQPLASIWHIRDTLRSGKYSNIRIGLFKLRSILKNLNLETKEKRYRFYRSR
ncbi:STAS domain-containing protein [bacterium]|nr:STAS domain-containing protein [bacterium]